MSKITRRQSLIRLVFNLITVSSIITFIHLPMADADQFKYISVNDAIELPDDYFANGYAEAAVKWLNVIDANFAYTSTYGPYFAGYSMAAEQLFRAGKWIVHKEFSFNVYNYKIVPKKMAVVQVAQAPKVFNELCIGCTYFISKGNDLSQTLILTMHSYGSYVEVSYREPNNYVEYNPSAELAEEFISDIENVQKQNNVYRNSVVEYRNGQITFMDGVDDLKMGWDDFILGAKIKEQIQYTIDGFINDYNEELWSKWGLPLNRGVLLYGPPGTGKSFIAKILAANILNKRYKSKVTFIYVSARHVNSVEAVREIFQQARILNPAVIFIEDIDLIAGTDRSDRQNIKNELMQQLSGIESLKGVLTIGTTNVADRIDPALLRSKRLGFHFEIGLPKLEDRKQLITIYLKNTNTASLDILRWAALTEKFSGAAIKELCEIATEIAMNENSYNDDHTQIKVLESHMQKAFDVITENNIGKK